MTERTSLFGRALWLRGERVARHRRTQEHTGRNHRDLNKEVNAALADPTMKARLADLGSTVLRGSPSDFRSLIADEIEKWAKVIRAANI